MIFHPLPKPGFHLKISLRKSENFTARSRSGKRQIHYRFSAPLCFSLEAATYIGASPLHPLTSDAVHLAPPGPGQLTQDEQTPAHSHNNTCHKSNSASRAQPAWWPTMQPTTSRSLWKPSPTHMTIGCRRIVSKWIPISDACD